MVMVYFTIIVILIITTVVVGDCIYHIFEDYINKPPLLYQLKEELSHINHDISQADMIIDKKEVKLIALKDRLLKLKNQQGSSNVIKQTILELEKCCYQYELAIGLAQRNLSEVKENKELLVIRIINYLINSDCINGFKDTPKLNWNNPELINILNRLSKLQNQFDIKDRTHILLDTK